MARKTDKSDLKNRRYWYRITKSWGVVVDTFPVGNILLETSYHGDEWFAPMLNTVTNQIDGGFVAEHLPPDKRPPELCKRVREKINEESQSGEVQ